MFCCFMGFGVILGGNKKYQMKSAEEVRKEFKTAGLTDFEKQSNFAKRFGGKEYKTEGLNFAIASMVNNFNAKSKPIFRSEIQQVVFLQCCVR
jgi:hypothetical protein